MDSTTKRTARIAGLLYLVVALTGPFVLMYVPGRLFVTGDATATAANILAHQSLFRAHILVGLLSELAFIAVVLALYHLLKGVSPPLAASMAILVLVDAPLAFLSVANEVATLAFVRGGEFLSVFDKPQRDALAMLLLNFDRQGSSSPRCSGDSGCFRSGCWCIDRGFFRVSWASGYSSTAWPTW